MNGFFHSFILYSASVISHYIVHWVDPSKAPKSRYGHLMEIWVEEVQLEKPLKSTAKLHFWVRLKLIPWLLLGSESTWFPHPESDPWVHESPGEECSSKSSSEQKNAAWQQKKKQSKQQQIVC